MLTTLVLLVAFSFLGAPFLLLRNKVQEQDVLLAPAIGLAATVSLGYVLSANLGTDGAASMAASIALLSLFAALTLHRSHTILRVFKSSRELIFKPVILCCIPALLLLIPAMKFGVSHFFGAVNFDFFYNSQDSVFLASHSVLEYSSYVDDAILPLTWSANPQGRFAIALIGSLPYKYFGITPLHFNAALLSSLVFVSAFSMAVFVRSVYRFRLAASLIAVFTFIFSAGFAQGYTYYLLGQISALPLFIAVSVIAGRLLDNDRTDTSKFCTKSWDFVAIVALLNALYIFYAILSFFAIATIGVACLLNALNDRKNYRKYLYVFVFIASGFVVSFVFLRLFSLVETKNAILDWVSLSFKTATASNNAPAVFSEYITEGFVPLLFGVFTYPIRSSIFDIFLGETQLRYEILLILSVVILVSFAWACFRVFKSSPFSKGGRIFIAALVLISISSAFAFFFTKSGYAIFKIGDWFAPLLISIYVAAFIQGVRRFNIFELPFLVVAPLIVVMNVVTAGNYVFSFFPFDKFGSFENAKNINGGQEIERLKNEPLLKGDKQILLALATGIENAWVANEFRVHHVKALTHNFQPLTDKNLSDTPCSSVPELPSNALVINDNGEKSSGDIVPNIEGKPPVIRSDRYAVYKVDDIDRYMFIGRGAYPVEFLSDVNAFASGLPKKLRWVEKGIEIFVYTRKADHVDIGLRVIPGFVNGPDYRNMKFSSALYSKDIFFDRNHSNFVVEDVALKEGMNCFLLESKDSVAPMSRHDALIRAGTPLDFRLLNFALGDLTIRAHKN